MPVEPTYIRWYNSAEGAKIASADVGSYEAIPYGTVKNGEKHATGKPPHPEHGEWQWGISCSRTSRTIVIDVDHPELWRQGAAYVAAGDLGDIATSVREDAARAHIVVEVPEDLLDLWPRQGPTVWGDVKSNGFSYIEGVHHSGLRYVQTGEWVVADRELLLALTEDRIFPGGRAGDGTGIMAGPWQDDEYRITSHDECVATVMSMVSADRSAEDIFARLEVIMPNREGDWPERDDYINEKIASAERKVFEREDKDFNWWDGAITCLTGHGAIEEAAHRKKLADQAAAEIIAKNAKPEADHAAELAAQWEQETEADYVAGNDTVLPLTWGNDQWLAQQIVRRAHQMGFAYAVDTGAYFRRSGDHWERCPEDPCRTIIALVADAMPRPADGNWDGKSNDDPNDPEAREKKLWSYLHMSSTASKVASAMRAVWPSLPVKIMEQEMDADGRVFWAGGVPYDLRTLSAAAVKEDSPHLLTAAYAPAEGPTPLWDELNEAQWPDPELREYCLNVLASVMRGGNKLLPNFKSEGNMGKTTRLMLLVNLLGTYAEQLPIQLLTGRTGHDESFLRLKGKRLVWMDETPPASKVATEKLKSLSGGGQMTGRAMFGKQSVTFSMQHTLILAGNDDLPLNDENVYAIRVRYLPITGDRKTIATAAVKIWDSGLFSDAWKKEAPAVLHEMMQRASRVMARKNLTDMPIQALNPFADAIIEQDHVARFVRECCKDSGHTGAGAIWEAYVEWGKRNNLSPGEIGTINKFGQRLTKMGYPANKRSATRDRPLTLLPGLRVY